MSKITPLDIQQQQFRTRFRGFDVHEVDTFLEQMAESFESMQAETEGCMEKIQRLEHEIRDTRNGKMHLNVRC